MTPAELAAIKARADAASPGPWTPSVGCYQDPDGDDDCHFGRGPTTIPQSEAQGLADSVFIAHARTDIPALLAALDDARAKSEMWKGKYEGYADLADGVTARLKGEAEEARAKLAAALAVVEAVRRFMSPKSSTDGGIATVDLYDAINAFEGQP